jgi:alkylation response protein AidB-like acyl-CoA dehydrogenase
VNILNIGRIKLAGAALGGAKQTLNLAIKYANERVQFGQPISSFGAIRQKLADMAIYTYVVESATYRCLLRSGAGHPSCQGRGADHAKAN